jgi:hypothetical protein
MMCWAAPASDNLKGYATLHMGPFGQPWLPSKSAAAQAGLVHGAVRLAPDVAFAAGGNGIHPRIALAPRVGRPRASEMADKTAR